MKTKDRRTCLSCGNELSGAMEFCPVCALRKALGGSVESGESSASEEAIEPIPEQTTQRFEHYALVTDEDGIPVELGRGAMGVTYKAFDVDLRCLVTLKVITTRYLNDKSARLRFLREARAAASVRHPNVASVFHLGRTGENYFYAMEFVEGETLESLIQRSGRLEAKLALEIATQVAAGLAAVHKQKLVHRDIKPSNIMMTLEQGNVEAVKIIDLGLAKTIDEAQSETAITIPGSFAGTPEFASPEQFAGLSADIRSDLYSLGVTLWAMLTGKPPFHGTSAEVMYQHQHAPLPLALLKAVPQPAVVLLNLLLEKDPARRFQSPAELLKLTPTIAMAIADGRTIDQYLGKATGETVRLRQKATEDLTAYDLYLRGVALVELLDRATNQRAIDVFKTAIDRDPNFALAHAGLARAYIERNNRFGGEKSLLDSAVDSCRLAIALDPTEACSYTMLARAYYSKGWYPQGDQALGKALELAPDDERANNLAGDRRFSREEFDKAYAFFRKAQSVNPNEPSWAYRLAEFCWKISEPDLAERWMQMAFEKDTNPQRHRVRELARMMFRQEFAAVRVAFAQLPPELQGYDSYTFEYFLTSTMRVGDWPTVIRSMKSYLKESPKAIWPRIYLAIALQMADRQTEAQKTAEQVAKRGLDRLKQPAEPDVPLEVPLYIACAYRLLNRKGEAYDFLAKYLADSSFLDLCFGLDDPILDPFKADPEFKPIQVNLNNRIEIARPAIHEAEAPWAPLAHILGSSEAALPHAKLGERGVAVLPFDSLSDNRNDSYFADGVQDEILSNLAKVSQLRVISRTSVMAYRSSNNRDLRSIANALGVANVVEGTVRRDGNRIRITIRLVDARTDEALWSERYDRDLMDIFAIQSEIAQTVSSKLRARLAPEEQQAIEEVPTDDLEAYDLYLQAKDLITKADFLWVGEGDNRANFLRAIHCLEQAIHKDPKFALAYCLIAQAHDDLYVHRLDRTPERRSLGDTAVNKALRLKPDLPEVHLAAARHFCECHGNYERARVQVALAARALPNSASVIAYTAGIDRRLGRWEENTIGLQKALSLDPRNPERLEHLAASFIWLRRYRDAEQTYDRLIELKPDKPFAKALKAYAAFRETASLTNFRVCLEKLPSSMKDELDIASWAFENAVFSRDWMNAKEILSTSANDEFYFSYGFAVIPRSCLQIWLTRLETGHSAMDARHGGTRDQLKRKIEAQPEDAELWSALGMIDAALGSKREAIEEAKRATEMLPISKDSWDGPSLVSNLAIVYALMSEPDLAFQQLAISVNTPGGISYGELKLDPAWDPIRTDPRFDKLLAELAPKE